MQSLQEDSTELRKNIKELRTQLKKEKKKLPPKAKRQEEDNDDDPMVSLSTMEDFLIKRGGLLRWTLVDDSWHATHSSAANQLFGFKTWTEAKATIQEKFPDIDMSRPNLCKDRKSALKLTDVTDLEKCLCIKMMDRMGLTKGRAAILYGNNERTVGHWRTLWLAP